MPATESARDRQAVGARGSSLPLVVLLADTFTMALGFYMLVPLALHLLEDLALTVVVVGVLAAIRSGSQQGLMPWSGTLADRFGHRRAIGTGVLVRASGFALFGFAESVPALVVASVLAGLGGSLFHPARYAMYARLAHDGNRVRMNSLREMLSNLGFVAGPLLGGLLWGFGFSWVCLASAGLFATVFVITMIGLPRDPVGAERAAGRGSLRQALRDRGFLRFCLAVAGAWVLFGPHPWSPSGAAEVLPSTIGLGTVYSAAAIVMVVTMLPLTRAADRWLRPEVAIALGCAGPRLRAADDRSVARGPGALRGGGRLHRRAGALPADHELPGLLLRPGALRGVVLRGARPGPGGRRHPRRRRRRLPLRPRGARRHARLAHAPEVFFALWSLFVAVFLARTPR